MNDKDFFDWLKITQPTGKLTQSQVDGCAELLAVVKPDVLQQCLAKIMQWEASPVEAPINTMEYNLTVDSINRVYLNVNTNAIPLILKHAPEYGINTKKQMCAFIATCIIESNGFNAKRESFAYSAKRLTEVFPKSRIPNLKFAQDLVSQGQKAIANHLYNGRMGNRVGTDDGWNYRGNSWIQLTGRDNHYAMQKLTGIPVGDNPELLEDLDTACIVTMAWWKSVGLNEKSEKINSYSDGYTLNTLDSRGNETRNYEMNYGARIVRETVNGGLNGYVEFCQTLEKCLEHL